MFNELSPDTEKYKQQFSFSFYWDMYVSLGLMSKLL